MNLLSMPMLNIFVEGGAPMMSLILICLLLSLFFLVLGFISLNKNQKRVEKMIVLASHMSLLGLVIGFFASMLGLVSAFDAIENAGGVSSAILAAGLKVSFITTLFGSLVFIIARVGIIVLKWMQKVD